MNIIKRIANWIIHLLGGYTKGEYEKHKEATDYWFHNWVKAAKSIKTERENYLAMLNLYNTAVEQIQNNAMGVAGAIDTIKFYCNSKSSCDECALYNKNGGCKIHEIPCYWGE